MAEIESYTLSVNAFEAGVLMGVIMQEENRIKASLSGVWNQLVKMKKDIEKADGVVKELLPGGLLKITDRDGTTIIRAPYPYEVEGN